MTPGQDARQEGRMSEPITCVACGCVPTEWYSPSGTRLFVCACHFTNSLDPEEWSGPPLIPQGTVTAIAVKGELPPFTWDMDEPAR